MPWNGPSSSTPLFTQEASFSFLEKAQAGNFCGLCADGFASVCKLLLTCSTLKREEDLRNVLSSDVLASTKFV